MKKLIILLAVFVAFASCDLLDEDATPVTITGIEIIGGPTSVDFIVAGTGLGGFPEQPPTGTGWDAAEFARISITDNVITLDADGNGSTTLSPAEQATSLAFATSTLDGSGAADWLQRVWTDGTVITDDNGDTTESAVDGFFLDGRSGVPTWEKDKGWSLK
jgi:hypothetical protein